MAVKFTCDHCGVEDKPEYDCYEGWHGSNTLTLEWWDGVGYSVDTYNVSILCHNQGKDSCYHKFIESNNLVRNKHGSHFKQHNGM